MHSADAWINLVRLKILVELTLLRLVDRPTTVCNIVLFIEGWLVV